MMNVNRDKKNSIKIIYADQVNRPSQAQYDRCRAGTGRFPVSSDRSGKRVGAAS
jgi:hypothetical protein